MSVKTIKVDNLARVEGEGALTVRISDDGRLDVKFRIFEPPRFFEAFLRGRSYMEAPDVTARICGICPVAYQMSASHAMENALGVNVDPPIRLLRRLLYCGEWIESHVLHVFFLHTPDFLGYDDAFAMAKEHLDVVKTALKVKKAGNDIVTMLGGREIHPINVRVGGFYKVPTRQELDGLRDPLQWSRDALTNVVPFLAGLPYPDFAGDYEFVALRHPEEYGMNEGRLVSSRGLDIAVADYERHFSESHVQHSTALHSTHQPGTAYCVGPLARFNLNHDLLTPVALEAASTGGLMPGCSNPFRSLMARVVETIYACEEALRLIDMYEMPRRPFVEVSPIAGVGCACTEAPRGILYHRYEVTGDGLIAQARIVPPTAQNQPSIEEDLRQFVSTRLNVPLEELTWQCEQAIRNYDPCISCATHFLKVNLETEPREATIG